MNTDELRIIHYGPAEQFLKSVSLAAVNDDSTYWEALDLLSTDGRARDTIIFSILSVQLYWKSNVNAYAFVHELPIEFTEDQARNALVKARCGYYDQKARYLYDFNRKFCADPARFQPRLGESAFAFRRRLMTNVDGLGQAKSAFATEMFLPKQNEVVCFDRHILRLYGYRTKGTVPPSDYLTMEQHFVKHATQRGMPCSAPRNLYWNQQQGFTDTRYWSYVLEPNTSGERTCGDPIKIREFKAEQRAGRAKRALCASK